MCVTYIEGISRHSHVRYYYLTRILWLFLHTRHILSLFSFFFVSTPVFFPFSFQTGTPKESLVCSPENPPLLYTPCQYLSFNSQDGLLIRRRHERMTDRGRGGERRGLVIIRWISMSFHREPFNFFPHGRICVCLNCNALHGAQKVLLSILSLSPFPRLRLFAIEMWNGCLWVAKRTSTNRLSL